jgi:hypothetical protein
MRHARARIQDAAQQEQLLQAEHHPSKEILQLPVVRCLGVTPKHPPRLIPPRKKRPNYPLGGKAAPTLATSNSKVIVDFLMCWKFTGSTHDRYICSIKVSALAFTSATIGSNTVTNFCAAGGFPCLPPERAHISKVTSA